MTAPQTPAVPMWGGGPGDPVAQGPHAIAFHGSSFCVSEPEGDVVPGRPQGYFRHDTRLLSRWELLIDGRRPEPLTRFSPTPAEIRFVQRMPPRLGGSDTALLVERRRRVGSRLIDEVRLRNLSAESVSVAVTLRVDGDFADVFAVKEGRVPASRRTVSVRPTGSLVIRGELPEQGVKVSMSGASYGPDGLRADVALDAFGSTVLIAEARPTSPAGTGVRRLGAARTLAERRRSTLSSIDPEVGYVIDRSLVDIDSLRITDPDDRACVAVAAGAPWFMTLFGRDSLLTAWMTLPLDRDLAVGTLRTLAASAGQRRSTRSPRRSPAGSCTRCGSARDAGLALGGSQVYYGTRRRHAAVRDAARRAVPLGRAAADDPSDLLAARRPRAGVDRGRTATATATGSSSTSAATRPRAGQPGLEGLLGRRQRSPTARLAEPPDRARARCRATSTPALSRARRHGPRERGRRQARAAR